MYILDMRSTRVPSYCGLFSERVCVREKTPLGAASLERMDVQSSALNSHANLSSIWTISMRGLYN